MGKFTIDRIQLTPEWLQWAQQKLRDADDKGRLLQAGINRLGQEKAWREYEFIAASIKGYKEAMRLREEAQARFNKQAPIA